MSNLKETVTTVILFIGLLLGIFLIASLFNTTNNNNYNIPQGCIDIGDGKGCY